MAGSAALAFSHSIQLLGAWVAIRMADGGEDGVAESGKYEVVIKAVIHTADCGKKRFRIRYSIPGFACGIRLSAYPLSHDIRGGEGGSLQVRNRELGGMEVIKRG